MDGIPDRFAALKERNFLLFTVGSFIALLGRQMLTVAVGWDIYEKTGSAMALGYIGLAQFLPVLLLTLPAGFTVDRFDRKNVLFASQVMGALATGGLAWMAYAGGTVAAMYGCLALAGIGRAFNSPAHAALLPRIVSRGNFTNAVTWNSMTYQSASILGPAVGGLMLGLFKAAGPVYLVEFLSCLVFLLMLLFIRSDSAKAGPEKEPVTPEALLSGIKYVWNTKIILAAITLDMFAVLFGGAIALLPVYAKDILRVGPDGLGWLQAAPAIGAILTGFFLARVHRFRKAGPMLLWTVIGFGICTIVFGFSRNFWLSFFMLFLTGAFDNVSVIIRQALVQLRTPDAMRGRVSAINFVFIGTSNELGGFESGLLANYAGPVFSVVFGGLATIATVISVALAWPQLRSLDALEEPEPEAESLLRESTV